MSSHSQVALQMSGRAWVASAKKFHLLVNPTGTNGDRAFLFIFPTIKWYVEPTCKNEAGELHDFLLANFPDEFSWLELTESGGENEFRTESYNPFNVGWEKVLTYDA